MARPISPQATLLRCAAAGSATLVLVLSWLPDSRLSRLPLFPAWIDAGGTMANLRTGIAMTLVTALIIGARGERSLLSSLGLAATLLTVAEGGQLILPSRGASLGDLTWGALGALVSVGLAAALRRRSRGPCPEASGSTSG